MNFAVYPLSAKIMGIGECWCEQQVGEPVDCHPVYLLGPGHGRVVGAQACFDMSERDAKFTCCQCAAKCARRITLDDDQIGGIERQEPPKRRPDHFGVLHGVGLPRAVEQ